MNVPLTPELEAFVDGLVKGGRYRSASEVVRTAIQLLQEQESEQSARLEALRRSIDMGSGELDRREGVPADEVFEETLKALRSGAA